MEMDMDINIIHYRYTLPLYPRVSTYETPSSSISIHIMAGLKPLIVALRTRSAKGRIPIPIQSPSLAWFQHDSHGWNSLVEAFTCHFPPIVRLLFYMISHCFPSSPTSRSIISAFQLVNL